MTKYTNLFSPFQIGNMTIPNRVVMMPMGTNFALDGGGISDSHINYYEQRARGGVGLIVVENVCIDYPLGFNGATQLRMDHDRFIPGLSRLCEAVHRHGGKISVQLNHAGASAVESRIGMQPVSASDLPSKQGGAIPRPLEEEELYRISKKFAEAARRAQMAGFDSVEVHCGHSYLLNQFLSPTMNRRTDEYGGSPENRARFPKMVMESVRRAVGPNFPISVRVSLDEFVPGGNKIEDTLLLMEHFCEEADFFSVSAGLNDSIQYQIDSASLPDGWRAYMAKMAKERFQKPVIAMGNIRTPELAESLLASGETDLIGIGRGLIAEPEWARKCRLGRENELRHCISCNVGCAGNRIGRSLPIRCTVNPAVDVGENYHRRKIQKHCNVVVIGGGVAGLEAACTAAEVGCTVFLMDRKQQLGGLVGSLVKVSEKFRSNDFLEYQIHRAENLPNLYRFSGVTASVALLRNFRPDIIVNATGSKPYLPPIPGLKEALAAKDNRISTIADVVDKPEMYQDDLSGKHIIIVGGGSAGSDAVEFFGRRGATLTIVEQQEELFFDLDPITRSSFAANLEKYNVRKMLGTTLESIAEEGAVVRKGDAEEMLPFDHLYLCLGMCARAPLMDTLQESFKGDAVLLNIGNSVRARRMIDGVREGREILNTLEMLEYFSENDWRN